MFRKTTWRTIALYSLTLLLLALADPRPATFAAGCVLVGLAWLLRIWAFGHLDKNLHMVTTGPYAHSRNPAYVGSLLALLGIGLAAGNVETVRGRVVYGLVALLVVVFFFVYLPRKFEREYPRLQKLFGERLERHAANVPNFFPRLTPWRSGDERRFSLARVTGNHEWPWGVVLGVMLILIWTADRWSPLKNLFAS